VNEMMVVRDFLKYYRSRINKIRLYRPPPEQGLTAFIKRRLRPPVIKFIPDERMNLFLNRYCNLKCYSCAALGMNPPRDETTIDELTAFLKNIEGYKPGTTFMLTGGEPTAMDHGKLETICNLIHKKGYKTALLTNGFKLIPTEWIDIIILDKHGINDDEIAKWENHLKDEQYDTYEFREKQWHMDIPYSLKDNITEGARCGNWITSATLWKDIVYPCCNMMCAAWWDNDIDQDLAQKLREAGWNVYNPDLVNTILNWRETLPGEAYRVCQLKCWREASKTKWVKIT